MITGTGVRQTGALSAAGNPSRGQDNTKVGEMTAGVRDTITGEIDRVKWKFYCAFLTNLL